MSAATFERCDTQPCPTCPWRTDSDPTGQSIPGFSITKMRNDLANTVGDGDSFRPIMACHLSRTSADRPCVGYLHQEGWSNLAVRLGAIEGRYPLNDIDQACQGIELFGSFGEMLDAYEQAQGAIS